MSSAPRFPDGRWGVGPPLALCVLALMPLGCATRGSVSRVRDDVGALRMEVAELRLGHEASVRDLARVSAQNRALEARLTEVVSAQRTSAADLTKLQERVDAAEAAVRAAKVLASLPSAPAAPPGPPVAPPVSAPPKEPAARPGSPEQAYHAALATFRAREHGQAVLDFLDFIAKYPKHPLVANAQYWIGEAYYVQRDYRQAQTEFQKVLATAPGSAKAGDALLKIGYCQLNLHDTTRARVTWQRVLSEFPKSEAAGKARTLLNGPASAAVR